MSDSHHTRFRIVSNKAVFDGNVYPVLQEPGQEAQAYYDYWEHMKEPPETPKGCGTLRVTRAVYADLGSPVTPQDWHTALLLPDTYEVEKVNQLEDVYELYILSYDIPIDPHMFLLPEVMLILTSDMVDNEHRLVTLTALSISRWNGNAWIAMSVGIPVSQRKQRIIETHPMDRGE